MPALLIDDEDLPLAARALEFMSVDITRQRDLYAETLMPSPAIAEAYADQLRRTTALLDSLEALPRTFTVVCNEDGGKGTSWISTVDADDEHEAAERGREQCAADWNFDPNHVKVTAVMAGDVEVLEWNDH